MKILVFLISLTLIASAATAKTRAEKREANQDQRIENGVQSGELTQKEATRLEAGQARVDQTQDSAQADGKVTKKEKRHVEKMQDRQSKKIHRQKHDRQRK